MDTGKTKLEVMFELNPEAVFNTNPLWVFTTHSVWLYKNKPRIYWRMIYRYYDHYSPELKERIRAVLC